MSIERNSKVFVPVSVSEKVPATTDTYLVKLKDADTDGVNLDTFEKDYLTKEGFYWLEEKENVYVLSEQELRMFANIIFNMIGAGFIGRAAFIDDCLDEFLKIKK